MTKLLSFQPLLEGISHLEDLGLQEFIRAVQNIAKMQASEKLDGANLWFGLDDEGRLYTSRAGKRKNAENMYSESDYPHFAAYNGFRAAHAALQAKEDDIKKVLRPGDTAEIEVLFGRQPNAVTYGAGGKNYIAFLRGVEGTNDVLVDQLANSLNGTQVIVKVDMVDTIDGENLKLVPTDVTYQFVGVQKIDTAHLKETDVSKQLQAMNKYLQTEAGVPGRTMTNFDLATASLGSFDKEVRAQAKEMKTKVLATILTSFKLPIKRELLDKFVAKIKSPLAGDNLTPDEDIGIEGVVLKDPETGEQIKLVDKDTFTTINTFNHAVRGTLSGVVKTTDSEASLEAKGGLLGELKIMIADLLGNRDLARTAAAKKIFTTLKGKTPEETVNNVAKQLTGGEDYRGTQRKIEALVDNTRSALLGALKDFKNHKEEFQLNLKNGKSMGYTAEVIRRTLVSFAEAKRDLDELSQKIHETKNLPQLVALLYGRIAKAVHSVEEEPAVAESKVWAVILHPEKEADLARDEPRILAGLKKVGKVKLTQIIDQSSGGGYEFEVRTGDDATEDDIWRGIPDVAWGGSVLLKEDTLLERKNSTNFAMYQGTDGWTIINRYLATYIQCAVIFKSGDKEGIRMLRDQKHATLNGWNTNMSALNFWGYPVWRAGTPAAKKLIGPKASAEIFQFARQCPASYWKFLHRDIAYGKDKSINWGDHQKAIAFLQRMPGMNVDRVNSLLKAAYSYDTLSYDEKVKFHAKFYYYTQQFIPTSPLAPRIRAIYDDLLFQPADYNQQMTEMKLIQQVSNAITEDGEAPSAGAGGAGLSSGSGASPNATGAATNAGAIANYQSPLFGEKKLIRRMKRNPDITRYKFPRPKNGEIK